MEREGSLANKWDLPLEPMFENRPPIANERDAIVALRDALVEFLPGDLNIRISAAADTARTSDEVRPDIVIVPRKGRPLAVELETDRPIIRGLFSKNRPRQRRFEGFKIGNAPVAVKYFRLGDVANHLDRVVFQIKEALDKDY